MAFPKDQPTLFGSPMPPPPDGFRCSEDFISGTEERDLIAHIEMLELHPYQYATEGAVYAAKRLVTNFGDNGVPFPGWLTAVRVRAAKWAGYASNDIVQAHMIKYLPGTPIGWHRDSPPYRAIIGVSLGSPARFQLRRRRPDGKFDRFETIAEPRSVYSLSGPARSEWQHGIPPVEDLRYSITFRTLR